MRTSRSPLAAAVLVAAVVLAFADASVVVLALPDMYGEFDTTIVGVSWVITAYAVVLTGAGFLLAGVSRRGRSVALTGSGLVLFAAASAACAAAPTVGSLTAFRCVQGLGGALLLVGSLEVLRALHPSGARLWATAGTAGLAVGPALGGVLTDLFEWRVVFAVQAPVAGLALLVVLSPRARAAAPAPVGAGRPVTGGELALANLALVLVSAALVGALFLAVLLVIEVWRYSPIGGAVVVSALPAGALLAGRLFGRPCQQPGRGASAARAGIGCLLLAAGLVALGLLPSAGAGWAAAALACCGAGLGLVTGVLDMVADGDDRAPGGLRRASALAIGCRHAGLVLGLMLFAPMLANGLDRSAEYAALSGTASILDANVGLREKVAVAKSLRDAIEAAPRGQMPDLEQAFAGRSDDAARAGEEMQERIEAVLTRAFRPEFLLAAALALAAAVPALLLAGRGPGVASPNAGESVVTGTVRTVPLRVPALLAIATVAAGALIAGEVAAGAWDYGRYRERDPCTTGPDPYPGKGMDAVLQRIALSGLDGAACELEVTREALVLSLDGNTGLATVDWDRKTVQKAVRSGLVRAIDDADDRGSVPGWAAGPLKEVAKRAPVEFALGTADKLSSGWDALRNGVGGVIDRLFG